MFRHSGSVGGDGSEVIDERQPTFPYVDDCLKWQGGHGYDAHLCPYPLKPTMEEGGIVTLGLASPGHGTV